MIFHYTFKQLSAKAQILALLIGLFLTMIACQNHQKNKQDVNFDAVSKTLDAWHQAASEADYKAYFDLLTDDAVFVGTAQEEVWNKKAFMQFAKPFFDKGKAWHFTKIGRHIYTSEQSNNIVWFDETLNTWMGVCRGSGVMVFEHNNWRIKHYVLSLTVPNDKMPSVIKVIGK